jgi:hypothetical protein
MVMKRFLLILGIALLGSGMLSAQSLIGRSKEEVAERIKKDHREFRKDASVIKQRFNYLKYVNGIRTKTWIIYFNDEDIAKTSRLVCDYGEMDQVVKSISNKYQVVNDSVWTYEDDLAGPIKVELLRQEWYFTVQETRKK